jgi:hypothetical protein
MTRHFEDLEHLPHATWKLSDHYYNLLCIKAHYEEAGMAVPSHYLTEISRTDNALEGFADARKGWRAPQASNNG